MRGEIDWKSDQEKRREDEKVFFFVSRVMNGTLKTVRNCILDLEVGGRGVFFSSVCVEVMKKLKKRERVCV